MAPGDEGANCKPRRWRVKVSGDHPLAAGPPGPAGMDDLLRPYDADRMEAWPVGARVDNVRNDGPDLSEPA